MGLSQIGKRFQGYYKTTTSKRVSGQFLSIPDTSRVSNFLSPRRYFRTSPETNLRIGDVLIANGTQFIVAEHGDGFYKTLIYKHFKMFEVDSVVELYKKTKTVDTITGLKDIEASKPSGKIYLSIQPGRYIEDSTKFSLETHTAVCNRSDITVDDMVGDFVVTKVDHMLGIAVLELKRP